MMDDFRFPFTRASIGDVAEAGVVGETKALSLGLGASRLLLLEGGIPDEP